MTVDPAMIVAEHRTAELVEALQAALRGDPHWRRDAGRLLLSISALEMPEDVRARLKAADDAKRRAEILDDMVVCNMIEIEDET